MPPSHAKRQPDEPLYGMDYGVPPRYMLMANPALMELWNQAKCLGLAYLKLPKLEAVFDLPCVAIMFEDVEKGVRVFNLLKSWDCEPGSGLGTDISFIEDRAANSYTMALGPNIPEMVKRLLDPSMLEDYSLLTVGLGLGKTLTLSERLRWLRDQARTKPVAFAPGTKTGEALIQHAFLKADVEFFDKENVPKDTIKYARSCENQQNAKPRCLKPLPIDPAQITQRRVRQLKRFYAVTAARLEHNPRFVKTSQQLSQNYERWQMVQAACNILCTHWFPELRAANGRMDFHRAYDALRHRPEAVSDESALHIDFVAEAIEAQIAEDVTYLRDQVRPEAKNDNAVLTLRQLGLLR